VYHFKPLWQNFQNSIFVMDNNTHYNFPHHPVSGKFPLIGSLDAIEPG